MDFDQIAKELGITKREVIKAYDSAIRKLKMPSADNQKFWDYIKINIDDKDRDGIISSERS